MSKAKVPLQVYLKREDREYYLGMHKRKDTRASEEIRDFIERKIKADKKAMGV